MELVIKNACLQSSPVGSRITCVPAPTDTDQDFLCLVKSVTEFEALIFPLDYVHGGSVPFAESELDDQCKFSSYTRDEVNLIVTESEIFFQRFIAATSVAKLLNILPKQHRIALFQAVLYGNPT